MASHFDEKSGIIPCVTSWGRWWQTVEEVWIEVNLKSGTRAKDVKVDVKPNYITCSVCGDIIFEGKFFATVIADEVTWTVEGRNLLQIQLVKASTFYDDSVWTSLLESQFQADPWTVSEMKKKIDLEKFQIENPGFDFSKATLSKTYN